MKRNRKKFISKFYFSVILMLLIISMSFLNGCTRFVDKSDKEALKNDFGFISREKSENTNEIEKSNKEKPTKKSEKAESKALEDVYVESKNCKASSAKVNGVSKHDVEKMLEGTYDGNLRDEKIVFLTFDDGPSKNTLEILDILNKYDVKGTFFVLGNSVDVNPGYLKNVYEEGNAIGNHTYNHSYKRLYPNQEISINAYMEEYYKTENSIKKAIGRDFESKLIRMPGGEMSRAYYNDPNLPAFNSRLKDEKIANIDWNALNGDAEGQNYSVNELIDYAKKSSAEQKHVVLLMHDTEQKYLTVKALPQVIEHFKTEGYSFKIMI